eukprot:7029121-Ditylum_brightwellii.AAC.1
MGTLSSGTKGFKITYTPHSQGDPNKTDEVTKECSCALYKFLCSYIAPQILGVPMLMQCIIPNLINHGIWGYFLG